MKPSQLSPGRVTYDLRRLRLHGLIERIPKSHRYRITAKGLRTAIFYTRLYNELRVFAPRSRRKRPVGPTRARGLLVCRTYGNFTLRWLMVG
jgi:DNA-binding IclR family transcriptional regulator